MGTLLRFLHQREQFLFHDYKLHYLTQASLEEMESKNPSLSRGYSRKEKIQSWLAASIVSLFLEDEIDVRYAVQDQNSAIPEETMMVQSYERLSREPLPSIDVIDNEDVRRTLFNYYCFHDQIEVIKMWYRKRGWETRELTDLETEVIQGIQEIRSSLESTPASFQSQTLDQTLELDIRSSR